MSIAASISRFASYLRRHSLGDTLSRVRLERNEAQIASFKMPPLERFRMVRSFGFAGPQLGKLGGKRTPAEAARNSQRKDRVSALARPNDH